MDIRPILCSSEVIKVIYKKLDLNGKTHKQLVDIILDLQRKLDVAKSWWEFHAENEQKLLEELHGIKISDDE